MRNRSNRSGQSGFSLLELLIVLMIVGLTAALVFPTLNGNAERKALDDAVWQLEAALTQTRIVAHRTGRISYVEFHPDERYFDYGNGRKFRLENDVGVELKTSARYETPRVSFLPSGQSSGAEFLLATEHYLAELRVDWLTSSIHVVPRRKASE